MSSFVQKLMRRKVVDFGHSDLRRVLGILDLTMLGVGSTIGVGIYVLAGEVSRSTSGPAVTIAFLIAGVASLFAGLCYAEFGARVPKAGSAYVYTYVCIGEFVAFVVGWNLILEYVIGTASVARGFSQYVDALADNKIEEALYDAMPLVPEEDYNKGFLSPYPDFLSFGLAVLLSVVLALGVKESSFMNNIFTGINIVVIAFVIIAAGTQANPYNWKIPSDEIDGVCNVTTDKPGANLDWGTGGFAPFGFEGIMQGAATCFFGFVGFDVIATTGEEAINPSRTIPLSIGFSLFIVFLSYFGVSAVITLVIPYCLQDEDAPLVYLFEYIGWGTAKWFVSIGALFGFSASLFGGMFPLPRVIYAMASDGLVFRTLATVSKRFQTPTLATAISGVFAGVMAMFFNLDSLVDMMSIGTLMAYTIVAVCVMLLRYTDTEFNDDKSEYTLLSTSYSVEEEEVNEGDEEARIRTRSVSRVQGSYCASDYFMQLFNTKGLRKPTDLTASLVTYAILSFCVLMLVFDILLVNLLSKLAEGNGGAIAAIIFFGLLNILNVFIIARQPESKKKLSFKVPLVPWLPAFSTFINLYLMCNLQKDTWLRFLIWMIIGLIDYFAYGLWHSSLRTDGKTSKGLDNLAYSNGSLSKQQLVIPTIEIQPATPFSSEPNTPNVKPKEQRTPLPPSPLAAAEAQGSHSSTADPQSSKTFGNDLDGPISPVSAVTIFASLMTDKDDSEKNIENLNDSNKGKDMESNKVTVILEKKDEGNLGDVKKDVETPRSVEPSGVINELSEDGAEKALLAAIVGIPQLPSEISPPIDPANAQKTEDSKEKDRKTDDDKSDENEKPNTEGESKEKDGDKEEDTTTKAKHVGLPPLDLSSTNLENGQAGFFMYFGYGVANSSIEYHMQGKKPPSNNPALENIGTIFDSDSEEEILYSQLNSD